MRQVHQAQDAVGSSNEAGVLDPHPSNSSQSEEEPTPKRAKRHSKKAYRSSNLDPTQLQFYPSQWRDILEAAKTKYRLSIVMEMLFPDRKKKFNLAVDCLDEALAEHETNGGLVEDGELLLFFFICDIVPTNSKFRFLPKARQRHGHPGMFFIVYDFTVSVICIV